MHIVQKCKASSQELASTKGQALASLLLAITVVMGYFANFSLLLSPSVKISFSYLPKAMAGAFLGPVAGGMVGALGDIISFFTSPQGGYYFPGWTVNALLVGFVYGLFLYKQDFRLKNIIIAKLLLLCLVELLLGTLWLHIQFGWPYLLTLAGRAVALVVGAPVEVALIYLVGKILTRARSYQ